MEIIITFSLTFSVIFFILFLFSYRKGKGITRVQTMIMKKHQLYFNEKQTKHFAWTIVLVNSFILSVPLTISLTLRIGYIKMMGIAFILFLLLMGTMYPLVGILWKRKVDQNGK